MTRPRFLALANFLMFAHENTRRRFYPMSPLLSASKEARGVPSQSQCVSASLSVLVLQVFSVEEAQAHFPNSGW